MKCSICMSAVLVLVLGAAPRASYAGFTTVHPSPIGVGDSRAVGISGNNIVGVFDFSGYTSSFLYNGSSYTMLTPPSTVATYATAVSGNNVVGWYNDGEYYCYGFLYNGSSYSILDFPGTSGTTAALGVSGNNVVGYYYGGSKTHGFLYNGLSYTNLDPPGSILTTATGVSGSNVVGFYDSGGNRHGFLYSGSSYTTLDFPGSVGTTATDVSGSNVVGSYSDGTKAHGFLHNGSSYIAIDVPGASETWAEGVSGSSVVGYYSVAGWKHGFLYDGSSYTTLDFPGAAHTVAHDVSGNTVVGEYTDVTGTYGFRYQVPAPSAYWTGAGDTAWSNAGNWNGPVPGVNSGATNNADTAAFSVASPMYQPAVIDLNRNLMNISFEGSVGAMTIGPATPGGNALLLTSGGGVTTASAVGAAQTINAPLAIQNDSSGHSGAYSITSNAGSGGATLTIGGDVAGAAASTYTTTLTLNGANTGANTVSGKIGDGAGAGKLAVSKSGPGVWVLSGANDYTGLTTVKAGTLQLAASAQSVVLTGAGSDIQGGKMLLDGAPDVLTPLTYSYHVGAWDRGQFMNTTKDASHGLGWENTGSQMKVAYTFYGDATLDGTVDATDLAKVLANYNQFSGMVWGQGDFDYNATVDASDLAKVLANYNQGPIVPGITAVGTAGSTVVPEPGTLVLLAAGLLGLVAYAWRKRK